MKGAVDIVRTYGAVEMALLPFHVSTKMYAKADTNPGVVSGRTTFVKLWIALAPRSRPFSSRSAGMLCIEDARRAEYR